MLGLALHALKLSNLRPGPRDSRSEKGESMLPLPMLYAHSTAGAVLVYRGGYCRQRSGCICQVAFSLLRRRSRWIVGPQAIVIFTDLN